MKSKRGRKFKVDREQIVQTWINSRAIDPNYTKMSLSRFFNVNLTTIRRALLKGVKDGTLPEDTFEKGLRLGNRRAS